MKEKEEELQPKELQPEEIQEKDSNYLWLLIVMFILFAVPIGKSKENNDRESLVNKINESDLSNSEKKRIIEILLG